MQTVEITAKSVDEATKAAATKLGVPPQQVKVTVLEETKGLFGKSNVRVRAEVVEETPTAEKPAKAPKVTVEETPEPAQSLQEALEPPAVSEPKKGRNARKAKPESESTSEAPAEETSEVEVSATTADGDRMLEVVQDLLSSARLQVNARVGEINGRYVNIVLDGKDAAFLVGKHGEVLNALQYLMNVIVSRRVANGVRATLDCNDYRRRREEALTGLATKIANEVKQRGEEAVLDALPAFERRVVHKALSEITGVTTYSEGEEPNRRVVIAPAE